jgi:hypothetical protein
MTFCFYWGLTDAFNLNLGKLLAVAFVEFVPFTALFLEHHYFIAFGVREDGGFHRQAADVGGSYAHAAVLVGEQHRLKLNGIAFLAGEVMHIQFFTGFCPELLTCNFCCREDALIFGRAGVGFFSDLSKHNCFQLAFANW